MELKQRRVLFGYQRLTSLLVLVAVIAVAVGVSSAAASRSGGMAQQHASDSVNGLKVGYMTITPINQGSWDPQEYGAFHKVAVANHWKVQMAQTVAASQAEQVLTGFATAGDKLIFVTSQTFEPAVRAVAPKFPNSKFFVMDATSSKPLPNEGSYTPNWYEIGYLGGAAAGLVTKTGKIGLITGQPLDASAEAFGTARAGAKRFAHHAKTFVSYTNDWLDPSKGAAAAQALISKGCDVTFSVAGAMEPAILRTDASHHAYGIGLYRNESSFAPGAVPASVLLNWGVAYKTLINKLTHGTWKPSVGLLTIKNGGLGTTRFKGVPKASKDTKRLKALVKAIRSGKVKVPHTKLKTG